MPQLTKRQIQTGLLLLPWFLATLLFIFLPALLSLALALTQFDALTAASWHGLRNFVALAQDPLFTSGLASTLGYSLAVAFARQLTALALGVLLYPRRLLNWLASVLVVFPSIMPQIAYVLVWLVAFNPRFGSVNALLRLVNLPTPAWLIEPWGARWALFVMALWLVGESFVVILVSLYDVPRSVWDSAEIDGASRWQQLRYLTIPLLSARLLLLFVRDLLVATHASFLPTLLLTKGGPGNATLFIPMYSWQLAFEDLRFGYAAAAVWTLYAALGAIVWVVYRLLRRRLFLGSFG